MEANLKTPASPCSRRTAGPDARPRIGEESFPDLAAGAENPGCGSLPARWVVSGQLVRTMAESSH